MQKPDKFLIGIVAGIVLLVVVAFVVVLARPEASYQPEDTAENVVFNYVLALNKMEYGRAYGYVSPTVPHYPADAAEFERHVDRPYSYYDNRSFSVGSSNITDDYTVVYLNETYTSRPRPLAFLDNYQYTNTFYFRVKQENGAWKIIDGEQYWYTCWSVDYPNWCDE